MVAKVKAKSVKTTVKPVVKAAAVGKAKAPSKKIAAKVKPKTAPKKAVAKKPTFSKTTKPAIKSKAKPVRAAATIGKSKPPFKKKVLETSELLLETTLGVLNQRKATEIVSQDLRGKSALADYVVIASGGSARQLNALAQYLREAFFKIGVKKLKIEGLPQGDWVLIDAGDVLIHLFRPEVRSFYYIEDIWQAKKPLVS